MNAARPGNLGATRVCPHCKATVLENSAVCPGCRHHLRFNTGATAQTVAEEGYCALDVDGTIRHKVASEPCEYCVVLDVRNERGEQVVRQVVGVGVLQAGESRRLHVAVDMLPVRAQVAAPAPAAKLPAGVPKPPPASPTPSSAKSFLKPPVPGQRLTPAAPGKPAPTPAPGSSATAGPAPRPGPSGSLFKSFRKP
jgi:hypothetical protein